MTRMSREFTLVLLGSSILTAGFFNAPTDEETVDRKAEEAGAERIGSEPVSDQVTSDTTTSTTTRHYHRSYRPIMFIHTSSYPMSTMGPSRGTSGPSPLSHTAARSGFGRTGGSIGVGS